MRSVYTRLGGSTALASALLTLSGLTLLPSVQAQAELDLGIGSAGDPTTSSTATLTDTGTTASGLYTYYDPVYGTPTPLSQQTHYDSWKTYLSSTANVRGGSIEYLLTHDTSTANVSGGSISELLTSDTSTANVSGGSISELKMIYTSTVNVSGGSINLYLQDSGNSTANVSGGSVSEIEVYDISTANVSGGNVYGISTNDTSMANVHGGNILGSLATYGTSTIDLFGTGFTETPVNPANGQYEVQGTLQDGTSIDVPYYDIGGRLIFSSLVSNPVPEASSVVSFGLLLALGLGGVVIAKKKKQGAAV